MSKVISVTALHYGLDYLYYALKSVEPYVDEMYILYSRVGSHGHRTDRPCPDTRSELIDLAKRAAGDKLRWIDGEWSHEGQQRDSIYGYAPDADVILVVDSDEVWGAGVAQSAITQRTEAELIGCQQWRVPIIHYWRSFRQCVLRDPAYPVRVIFPKVSAAWDREYGASYVNTLLPKQVINHFGYAQRAEVVEYKQHTHGHHGEWRRDVDWFTERFMANAQRDCHPVGSEFWNPEAVDPWSYLPNFMREHPYADMAVIP